MVIYIHRSEIWSDLCDVSSFLLARFIITRSKSMCGFAWKFPFFFMPFWNWLKYRYETLWNKIAEPRRGHNLVHIVYFRFWQINIFCTVPRLCLNMEIFETIGVLFFEKKIDDLEFFQCIKFLKNVSFLNEIVSVAKIFLKVTFRRQNSNQLSQFFKKPFCR